MEKFLIYQNEEAKLFKKKITDMAKAEKIAKLENLKINNSPITIVGIGTQSEFDEMRRITGELEYNELPHFKKLKANVDHYKAYGVWPKG